MYGAKLDCSESSSSVILRHDKFVYPKADALQDYENWSNGAIQLFIGILFRGKVLHKSSMKQRPTVTRRQRLN